MLSKNLPVMVSNRIEGIVTSNISIKDIKKNIDVQEDNDVYIIDSANQIVFKNNEAISKIETLEDSLKQFYNISELKASLEPDKYHKVNGDYIINSSLDNVKWKMVYIVPGNKIERSLLERAIVLGLINGAIILIAFLFLRILKRYYIKFSRIDELKTEFLMMISHDLKAPLYNILGFTELIQKKFSDVIVPGIDDKSQEISAAEEKIHRNLGIIEKEANRLTALVDDLLDLSRLDSGEAELNKEAINICQLCNEMFDTTFSLVDSKGIRYTLEIEPDLPDMAADRKKLMQVLVNIVSNAVKFTEFGSIVCKVEKKGSNIVFSVEDTGVGIPKDMQKIIFNKFERGKFQNDKRISGSGVGLSICKSIIELHNGEIWVVSKVNEGSTFSFSIPIEDK
jgi:signal transduction histidine kinase